MGAPSSQARAAGSVKTPQLPSGGHIEGVGWSEDGTRSGQGDGKEGEAGLRQPGGCEEGGEACRGPQISLDLWGAVCVSGKDGPR